MLLAILAVHALIQVGTPQRPVTAVRDSTPRDSIKGPVRWRLPVTAAVLASAYRDSTARTLLGRAQRARLSQDSSLESYDAKVRQRMSVTAGIGKLGPERLVYRSESAARVEWQRGRGARIEMTGGRIAAPMASDDDTRRWLEEQLRDAELSPIPYFPGSETLWIGGLTAQTEVSEGEVINPLAVGAEAYYTYESGQSVSFRLPDGRTIQLQELKVRPRLPQARLAVGSLWFDTSSGQLVRAIYRLAAPSKAVVNVSSDDSTSKTAKRISRVMTAVIQPMEASISAVVVEYGLFGGRFWLPRVQTVEGKMIAMFARIPVRMENSFSYASVNGGLDLPVIQVDTTHNSVRRPPAGLDSAALKRWRDSTRAVSAAARKARQDSIAAGKRVDDMAQCDTSATRVVTQSRYDARIPVQLRIPCDLNTLVNSPDLPESIYDPGESFLTNADAARMIRESLPVGAQAALVLGSLPAPRFQLGPSMTRYNRVEGFSTGILAEQELGAGLSATGVARFGVADKQPNFEVSLARTNQSTTIRLSGYRHLVSANDWGEPLSFRSSLAAFLFGRDEGFYYRATGAELSWTTERGVNLDWRAFAERQRSASQNASYSVSGTFDPNIEAANVRAFGGGVRSLHNFGVDPRRVRGFTDFRVEGASGDSSYGRAALDVNVSRQFMQSYAASLTLAGGSSVGQVPAQRRWFLGGTQTIRGQAADTAQSGNAFWMTRAELTRTAPWMGVSLFGDFGWVGDRDRFREVGTPLSGVGVGLTMMDGLIRFDVARGINPGHQTRFALYFGSRF